MGIAVVLKVTCAAQTAALKQVKSSFPASPKLQASGSVTLGG